jgi:hypothetical protein
MGRVTRFLQATAQPAAEPMRDQHQALADRPDQGLERVITSWPQLPKHIQRAILTLVGSCKAATGD